MAHVWLSSMDGHYVTRLLTANEAYAARAAGSIVVDVEDAVHRAWCAHLELASVFNALWIALHNAARADMERIVAGCSCGATFSSHDAASSHECPLDKDQR